MIKTKYSRLVSVFVFGVLAMAASKAAFATPISGKFFDRAITVVFENTNYQDAYSQPFMSSLAAQGANFTNFIAEAHPSQANYVALTAATMGGVIGDSRYDLNLTNLVDLFEAHGISWKVYAEGYPGGCYTGMGSGQYVRKHNPFISFVNIQTNPARCSHIVDASEFDTDLAAGQLPNYVFYIPDLRNDGHDTGVAYADRWYKGKFGPIIADAGQMKNTVLISTFDESGRGQRNLIYTTIAGPDVKPGSYSDTVNHYSLIRLIENNWSLGTLHRLDDAAPLIPHIWK